MFDNFFQGKLLVMGPKKLAYVILKFYCFEAGTELVSSYKESHLHLLAFVAFPKRSRFQLNSINGQVPSCSMILFWAHLSLSLSLSLSHLFIFLFHSSPSTLYPFFPTFSYLFIYASLSLLPSVSFIPLILVTCAFFRKSLYQQASFFSLFRVRMWQTNGFNSFNFL